MSGCSTCGSASSVSKSYGSATTICKVLPFVPSGAILYFNATSSRTSAFSPAFGTKPLRSTYSIPELTATICAICSSETVPVLISTLMTLSPGFRPFFACWMSRSVSSPDSWSCSSKYVSLEYMNSYLRGGWDVRSVFLDYSQTTTSRRKVSTSRRCPDEKS